MAYRFLGPDRVEDALAQVLDRLATGEPPHRIEVAQVDVKEEPGRRGQGGSLLPGAARNDAAAHFLAREMACFANTPGGGAIVVGVADDGSMIGTELEVGWLRHRIYELAERRLTVTVREVALGGTRLLVLTTPEAIEPIRFEGRVRWRVDDNCVVIDPTAWHTGRFQRGGHDWSAQPSGHTLADANPVALELARRYLRSAGDAESVELASATDPDLLRRLSVIDGTDRLTNAGSLLFVETPEVGIDYIRREVPGGDSTARIRSRRSLLEQVWEVDQASQSSNRIVHAPQGFARGQLRAIPERALREGIVNGVVHRDWLSPEPTTVEHVGDTATITSPGGFIGGIAPNNIITHAAVPRYRSLAETMGSLRLAEREGIGIDRMVRDMLAIGRPQPEIAEIAGPCVRVVLLGGDPDPEIVGLLSSAEPAVTATDVDALLCIAHLLTNGWVDVDTAAPVIQRTRGETEGALMRLATVKVSGSPLIARIHGVPAGNPVGYRLSDAARSRLRGRRAALDSPDGRRAQILAWAQARGRVSSTEAADLAGLSVPTAGAVLGGLEADGLLRPGRERKAGRGFFYIPASQGD